MDKKTIYHRAKATLQGNERNIICNIKMIYLWKLRHGTHKSCNIEQLQKITLLGIDHIFQKALKIRVATLFH